MRVNLFLCSLVLILALARNAYTKEVKIPQGILRGDTRTNRDGGIYYAFKNIPFAKPPVGDLRFKAPQPAEGWTGVRDATQDVPQCVQILFRAGQEDCLYLNVYTPELPNGVVTPKPVMVYIYGGAFMLGSSQESGLGAQFLLTKDVVVVTFNYRVGVFGYITLDDPDLGITGNAALKDQVLALQWVQDNIKYFGGDPNNVLIFGHSAGGMNLHLHLVSPMSRGLFHKAIAQSGVGTSPLVLNNVRNTAVTIAEHLKIPTEDWSKMLSLLQEASVDSLVDAEMTSIVDHWLFSLPKVEIPSNGSFLERHPMDIIRSGDFNQVPFMSGFTEVEGTLIFFLFEDDGVSPFVPDLTRYIPIDLEIEPGSDAEKDIVQRLKDFYYGGGEPTRYTLLIDMQLYGDFAFVFPHYRASVQQLKTALEPIYLYYFTALTELDQNSGLGPSHGAELSYLWYSGTTFAQGSNALRLSRNMVDMWTNFAICGDPTPANFEYTWKPMQVNQSNFLHIASEGSFPEVNVQPSVIQFWSDIYEDYYPN